MEEAQVSELSDLGFRDIFVEGVVPVFEIGTEAEACLGGERLGGAILSGQEFIFENESQELQGMELFGESFLSATLTGCVDTKEPHLMG
jgi:hypothetical protein